MRVIALTTTIGLLLPAGGCSALHWGGEDAGRTPGVHVYSPTLFTPAEISVTADLQADIEQLQYTGGTKETPAQFSLRGKFGQDVASVVREQPAKIDAVGRLQLTQAEYARVTWDGVRGLAAELTPVLKLLALAQFTQTETGLTATLPGGLRIGGLALSGPAELEVFFRQAATTVQGLAPDEPRPVPGTASDPDEVGAQ